MFICTVPLLSCFPVVTHSINGLTEVLESTTIKTEVLESTTFKTVEEKVRVINVRYLGLRILGTHVLDGDYQPNYRISGTTD